jgi:hypothetical protein
MWRKGVGNLGSVGSIGSLGNYYNPITPITPITLISLISLISPIKIIKALKAHNGSTCQRHKKALPIRIDSTTIEVPLNKGGFRGIVKVGGGQAASLSQAT